MHAISRRGPSAPCRGKAKAVAWSARELRRFLEYVETDRLYAAWRLAAVSGARRGEVLAASWRSVDLDGGTWLIDRQLVDTRGCPTFGSTKNGAERTLSLDEATVEALRRHRDGQLLERQLADGVYVDEDLCFAQEDGRPVTPKAFSARFLRLRKAAGVPTGTLHCLRHTVATLALSGDKDRGIRPEPLHLVAAWLGDDPTTVLGVYSHLLPRSDEQVAAAVAAHIDSPLTNPAI